MPNILGSTTRRRRVADLPTASLTASVSSIWAGPPVRHLQQGATTDYLAVRYFSSLATYKSNDYVIQAGVLYSAKADITTPHAFLGTDWNTVAIPSSGGAQYLPLSGGTLTGPLTGTDATFSGNSDRLERSHQFGGGDRALSLWSAGNLKLFYSGVTADGTTWFVASCDNAGAYRATSLSINRTDSGATFAGA